MSEAIISRRGGKRKESGIIPPDSTLSSTTITNNASFRVPNHYGNISVRIFGGGGGCMNISFAGSNGEMRVLAGGGGGWMNNGEFDIPNGTVVPITIGLGGEGSRSSNITNSGGTSSFGTYLSANGGEGGKCVGYTVYGGNGGAGGGTQGQTYSDVEITPADTISVIYIGGTGYQFGGGGASGRSGRNAAYIKFNGGNGGIWGGGGGGGYSTDARVCYSNGGNGGEYGGGGGGRNRFGRGSAYGGNGGNASRNAENGINTIGWDNVIGNCRGAGRAGLNIGGGGGFGGEGQESSMH